MSMQFFSSKIADCYINMLRNFNINSKMVGKSLFNEDLHLIFALMWDRVSYIMTGLKLTM